MCNTSAPYQNAKDADITCAAGVDWSNVSSHVDCRQELAHLLPDDAEADDLQSIKLNVGSETSSQPPFRSSADDRSSLEDHNIPDHSLNTWSAQMATRMLGTMPQRMSFRRKLTEKLPAGYGVEQPLLQQDSRIEEVPPHAMPASALKLFISADVDSRLSSASSISLCFLVPSFMRGGTT